MFNPSIIMKLMNAKNTFQNSHPKFSAFLNAMVSQGIDEGCIIDISVTRPDGRVIAGNMRVTQSDLDLIHDLQELAGSQQ